MSTCIIDNYNTCETCQYQSTTSNSDDNGGNISIIIMIIVMVIIIPILVWWLCSVVNKSLRNISANTSGNRSSDNYISVYRVSQSSNQPMNDNNPDISTNNNANDIPPAYIDCTQPPSYSSLSFNKI
jgi:hypothetical protein